MKEVEIQLHNIQSHENTKFKLKPGLNLILSSGNNVGKSTIFKALMFAANMPYFKNADVFELIRYGCNEAYISFRFETNSATLWLFRDGKTARAFFELPGTPVIRTLECPKFLIENLDFIYSADKKVLNFSDADSVQLIVRDSNYNDEVLSRILIDYDVERVKNNAQLLYREVNQDYHVEKELRDNLSSVIETLNYNDIVDIFDSEYPTLRAASEAYDTIVGNTDMSAFIKHPAENEIHELSTVLRIFNILKNIDDALSLDDAIKDIPELNELLRINGILRSFAEVNIDILSVKPLLTEQQVGSMYKTVGVIQTLEEALKHAVFSSMASKDLVKFEAERKHITGILKSKYRTVKCPVKGEVFYGETCIHVSD